MQRTNVIIAVVVTILALLIIILAVNQKVNPTSDQDQTDTIQSSSSTSTSSTQIATIKTSKGDIMVELRADKAPKTVANFIKLANDGFYDGLTFHRRDEGFVIQGGDPSGDGTGGPGYTVDAEITDLEHTKGAVAMARLSDAVNPTKASSGSQFYITLDPAHFLDGEYTVFGYVTEGMDVVDKIQVGDVMSTIEIN